MIPIISMTTNGFLLNLIVLLSPCSCISFLAAESASATTTTTNGNGVNDDNNSPYKIIFDGGSTGSRLHIFEFVEVIDDDDDENDENDQESTSRSSSSSDIDNIMMSYSTTSDINFNIDDNYDNNKPEKKKKTIKCVRRGSSRADIPLSAFGRLPSELINSDNNDNNNTPVPLNPTEVAAHLLPLFEFAANIIPSQYYESTGVYYQATAGMRLLEESEQDAVYDALYQGLIDDQSFVFRGMQRKDISTLSGEMEAYYGALSANYILGLIDTELRVLPPNEEGEENQQHHQTVGALDMGGSSTQIVYIAASNNDKIDIATTDSPTICPITPPPPQQQPSSSQPQQNEFNDGVIENTCQLSDEHFFSTSYLSYGVDQFRERLWGTLVEEYILSVGEKRNTNNPNNDDDDDDDTCDAKVIANPCANKGFEVEYNGYTLLGTGNTKECIRQTKRLIPHPEIPYDDDGDDDDEWVVGGIEHPKIRGKFLAMSLYFFSLDSLRVFSQPDEEAHVALNQSWPNPSIDELYKALDGLCSRDWHGDMALQEGVHAFTRAEVLPHRCLETVYMVTLLKDGFGFHPSSRDITFTFLVDGDEVEWTLGMALAMNADERGSTNINSNFDKDEEEEQMGDDSNNLNEIMNNTIEDETEDQFHLQGGSMLSQMFGVTLPPTHCC